MTQSVRPSSVGWFVGRSDCLSLPIRALVEISNLKPVDQKSTHTYTAFSEQASLQLGAKQRVLSSRLRLALHQLPRVPVQWAQQLHPAGHLPAALPAQNTGADLTNAIIICCLNTCNMN